MARRNVAGEANGRFDEVQRLSEVPLEEVVAFLPDLLRFIYYVTSLYIDCIFLTTPAPTYQPENVREKWCY